MLKKDVPIREPNPLGDEKIIKLMIRFSMPSIAGMVATSLYTIFDRIFIGNHPELGKLGLAGIAVSFPIMIIMLATAIFFGVGGATLFSIRTGEGKLREADQVLANAFLLILVSGMVYTIGGQLFLTGILRAFGASDEVLPYAVEYMRIVLIGSVFQMAGLGLNNFIRADGHPNMAMMTMFLGAGLNIALDPLFIYGFGWGMRGAALATVIAQATSFLWVMRYFFSNKSRCRLCIANLVPKWPLIQGIMALGLPGFLIQVANSVLFVLLNRSLMRYGGDLAISAMGIVNSLQSIILLPIIGIKQGLQPIISYNFGAKKFERVKEAVRIGIVAATGTALLGTLVIQLFPATLIGFFNQDPQLVEFGSFALVTWFLLLPFIGFQIVASNYFQAIGRPFSAIFLTLTRQVILLIPAILIFPLFFDLEGLLYAAPFADGVSVLLTAVWFVYGIRCLGKPYACRYIKGLQTTEPG